MSKKFKSQASSSRAAAGGFGGFPSPFGGFSNASQSDTRAPSSLSYVAEPPDLTRISEPNLVVAFKNLSKKDDITKTKALEDIKDTIGKLKNRSDDLEEGVLEAWTKVYPRTSIENSRRVRQLAHQIQGLIASLAGKRVARYLPKVIGAWLAGLYDNDKLVSRSVFESITDVFSTDEKRNSLWKVFQTPILEFVDDVILHQTVLTLSDERIVKPDDAESKFARVSATAILLFNRILSTASQQQLDKDLSTFHTLLESKILWSFAHHEDPFVRRCIYALLRSSLTQGLEGNDWKVISQHVISQALSISQLGSATDFSETILQLSQVRPQIWTTDFKGKSSASKRLHQYIKRGSQGASESYWSNLANLLQIIPKDIIAGYGSKTDDISEIESLQATALMEDFIEGLSSREEPRHNLKTGWAAYVDTGVWLSTLLDGTAKGIFVSKQLTQLFDPYVNGEVDGQWVLPKENAQEICVTTFLRLANHGYTGELELAWTTTIQKILQAVKLSLPEQSKDFRTSQDEICARAARFFKLEAAIISKISSTSNAVSDMFQDQTLQLVEGSIQVLQARNGKPYGAAAILEEAIRHVPNLIQTSQQLAEALKNNIPQLLSTPSADRIMSTLLLCRDWPGFESVLDTSLQQITETDIGDSGIAALEKLLSTVDFEHVQDLSHFAFIVTESTRSATLGKRSDWVLVFALTRNPTLPNELIDKLILALLQGLSSDEEIILETLFGLSSLAAQNPQAMQRFRKGSHGSKFVSKLLYLAESSIDEIAQKAALIEKKLKETVSAEVTSESSLEILKQGIKDVGSESLSIESLASIAEDLLQRSDLQDYQNILAEIFPSEELWKKSLEPFLGLPPRPSASITSPLGGAVHLVSHDLSTSFWTKLENVSRDSNGESSAFRLTTYATRLLAWNNVFESLNVKQRESLFYYFPLALQLIDDDTSIENSIGIIGLQLPEDRDEALEILSNGRSIISKWIRSDARLIDNDLCISEELRFFWRQKTEHITDTSPESYRICEVFVKVMSEIDVAKTSDELVALAREIRKSNPLRAAAVLAVWGPSISSGPAGTRLCNELVAEATGFNLQKNREGLKNIIFVNILTQGMKAIIDSIPTQRLVFLVKNLIQVVQANTDSMDVRSEAFKALAAVLRPLSEIYGSHWAEAIELLHTTWTETGGGDSALPVLHSSFRLFSALNGLVQSESNDDLVDAWAEAKNDLFESLISSLYRIDSSSSTYQPRDITADLLRRELLSVPVDSLAGRTDIFSLLAVQCKDIQQAAYEILHRYIPRAQEQVSFDVALSKTNVNLPDELLSLLLEAPKADMITFMNDEKAWLGLRSYMLSWKVVFDHFLNSSLPVQENYSANIKENELLGPLLDFTFDFLQKPRGKLLNASNFDIRSWDPSIEPSEKDTQWLVIHLYYLALKHLGVLAKNWWIDSKKRIKGPVETWTEKYISPFITEDALNGVSEWTETQNQDDERPLSVKVSHRTGELVASIPVDEDSPPVAIAISLPPSYPLQPAIVTGRSRVLVDEKKWRSWLLAVQGVIMFSNGSLVDGLLAFRRNVQGALKGQSECAICYSVISTDMQTPNKRCATCKNTFHSVCLFRWFKSSNQSTCPLCRNNFVYV
ncbi:putative RING zinc finger protein [Talaromyces proteolyticus]|uniref:E3 ubiquitin-protein ligase listerin n=1 Tax=Talaromyces proteolyticus TaxID=1131652 RepID=A0AAD4KWQ6_9EURO|nr:putative RING zinc finger protein [Talaromyces proteolyticus]KAH8698598.1 putative RING zinc finger protein [Talaromyces proteolyticus]